MSGPGPFQKPHAFGRMVVRQRPHTLLPALAAFTGQGQRLFL
jgi:hypothetical protein